MASILLLRGLVDLNQATSTSLPWTWRLARWCNLLMARDETKIRVGRPMGSIWFFQPSVGEPVSFTPCWPMVQRGSNLQPKETTKSLFGLKQVNRSCALVRVITEEETAQDEREKTVRVQDCGALASVGAGGVCVILQEESSTAAAPTTAGCANSAYQSTPAGCTAGDQQFHG